MSDTTALVLHVADFVAYCHRVKRLDGDVVRSYARRFEELATAALRAPAAAEAGLRLSEAAIRLQEIARLTEARYDGEDPQRRFIHEFASGQHSDMVQRIIAPPSGPWDVRQLDSARWNLTNEGEEWECGPFTEPEAVVVRDALNRVSRSTAPKEGL